MHPSKQVCYPYAYNGWMVLTAMGISLKTCRSLFKYRFPRSMGERPCLDFMEIFGRNRWLLESKSCRICPMLADY